MPRCCDETSTSSPRHRRAARECKSFLPAHLDYQIKMERDGILFGAGPLFKEGETVPYGGMIIVRAKDEAEARAHADADPFHAAGCANTR